MKIKNLSSDFDSLGRLSPDFYLLNEVNSVILPGGAELSARGAFFDLYKEKHSFYLISKITEDGFWRDIFWKQRTELSGLFEKLNCKVSSEDLINLVRESCLAVMENANIKNYYGAVIKSSNEHFISCVKNYMNGEIYRQQENMIGTQEYSHVKLFSWIYFNELNTAMKLNAGKSLSILELGSSFGNSIFSKYPFLHKFNKNVHNYGVDINSDLVECASKYAKDNNLENIFLHQGDVLDQDSFKRHFNMPNFDIVTSSHLLEHLEGNPHEIISNWIQLANYALVLSVPFDRGLSGHISGHNSHFTEESLSQISCDFLRMKKNLSIDDSCVSSGILIFYKLGGDKNQAGRLCQ